MSSFIETLQSLDGELGGSSGNANRSTLHLLLTIFKIHHIMFKSETYSMVIKGKLKSGYQIKDHRQCHFGRWYDTIGQKLFSSNPLYHQMAAHHQEIHRLLNANLEYLEQFGNVSREHKAEVIARFAKAEGHTRSLFELMDRLSHEYGERVDFSTF
ncbi:MAG: CZB domain-containing protein [Campylobacterales bacterium]|nr:CZB domain-containing protein [Campylobacterales bacterium]